jgi:predicted transposase YdaD
MLAVLSAMAHGQDPNTDKSVRIALLAQMVSLGLDAERSTLYCDLILHSLSEAARQVLLAMDASRYQYQSEFAQRYFGQGNAAGVVEGRVQGRTEGRVEIILKLLATRYGAVSAAAEAHVRTAGTTELDRIAERVLTACTIEEALGIPLP